MNMDSIPDREFSKIYDRVSEYIDLAGCVSVEDIEDRMIDAIELMRKAGRKAKKTSTRKKWYGRAKLLMTLGRDGVPARSKELKGKTRVGFATRTAEYVMLHPRSRIALTLTYGKEKARKIMNERLRKRLRTLARKSLFPYSRSSKER
jgi:hypothetical protein